MKLNVKIIKNKLIEGEIVYIVVHSDIEKIA
jgi:hypothetical protein